jgi:hypothetical protein
MPSRSIGRTIEH